MDIKSENIKEIVLETDYIFYMYNEIITEMF